MPRQGTSKKPSSQNRHENGNVEPGKKISKRKSIAQPNGSPRRAAPHTPPRSPVSHPVVPNVKKSHENLNGSLNSSTEKLAEAAKEEESQDLGPESVNNLQEAHANGYAHKSSEAAPSHRNEKVAHQKRSGSDVNFVKLSSAILKTCPTGDTIAILILLLQLPPLVLTLIQFMFASLTVMPPSGISAGSLISLFDIFPGTAGPPSLWTMVFVDVVCLGLWYCLWPWARSFILDLAQVQVAITLGGGNAGKDYFTSTTCVFVMFCIHLLRDPTVRKVLFNYVFSIPIFSDASIARLAVFLPPEGGFGPSTLHPNPFSTLFAIHITTQAFTAIVRKWFAAKNHIVPPSKTSKKSDTEALAGSHAQDVSTGECGPSVASSGAELVPPSTPGFREGRDRAVSAKKRRRQAHQVRSQQPFWAALASTKVTVMREMEHSKVSNKAAGQPVAGSEENAAAEECSIWITEVDSSSIRFEASDLHDAPTDCPLYVKVNGAHWTSVCLEDISDKNTPTEDGLWRGEISGLAPNCTYTCSFVQSVNNEVISALTVMTPAIADADPASALPVPAPQQALRPSSPVTTLKNSIGTHEAKLNESHNRLLARRKKHQKDLGKMRSEIDSHNARLNSTSDDSKQQQKLHQLQRDIEFNSQRIAAMDTALHEFSTIPAVDADEWETKRACFEKQRSETARANDDLANTKGFKARELDKAKDALQKAVAKREKSQKAKSRLQGKYHDLSQARAEDREEKERQAATLEVKEKNKRLTEENYTSRLNGMQREIDLFRRRTRAVYDEIQATEKAAQHASAMAAGPLTPEGPLPGTNPQPPRNSINPYGFPSFPSPAQSIAFPAAASNSYSPALASASPFQTHAVPALLSGNRSRSASNRSKGPFHSDFDDADPIPPSHREIEHPHHHPRRQDSGSSRAASSGSPVVGIGGGFGSPANPSHHQQQQQQGRGSPGQQGTWI